MDENAKQRLSAQLRLHLERDVATLEAAAAAAAEAATHEESQPENEYDTRGLEAAYLAGAQLVRLTELRTALATLVATKSIAFAPDAPIGPGALVELDHEGKPLFCFVTRVGAGYKLSLDAVPVVAVTPSSALGQAIVGRKAGEVVVVGRGAAEKEYEIVRVT